MPAFQAFEETAEVLRGAGFQPGITAELFDPDSPRSVRYGASAIRDYLAAISGPAELTTPARIIGRLHADLRYDDEAQMRRGDFVGLLDHVVGELAKTHDAIATQYFVT